MDPSCITVQIFVTSCKLRYLLRFLSIFEWYSFTLISSQFTSMKLFHFQTCYLFSPLQLTALKLGSGDLLQVTDHLKIEIFETVKYCGGVFEAYAGNVGGGDICLRYCELLCRYFWWWLLLQAKKEEEERERRERREQRAVDRSEKFWYFEFWHF